MSDEGNVDTSDSRAKNKAISVEVQAFLSTLHKKYELEGFMPGWMLVMVSSTLDDDGDPSDTCMLYAAPDQSPTFTCGVATSALEWVK